MYNLSGTYLSQSCGEKAWESRK